MVPRRLLMVVALGVGLVMTIPSYSSTIATFNFDSDTLGQATPFADTNNGLTATFSSPADPGGFQVTTGFFSTLTGNILYDPGPAGASSIPLDIAFSANATSLSMVFVTDGSGTFVLDAYENGTPVGSATAQGVVPPGFSFPEGTIDFSSVAPFNSIVLTSPSTPYFAIDNLSVGTATPEPSTLLLIMATFLMGLGPIVRKKL